MQREKQGLGLGIGFSGVGPRSPVAAEGKAAFTVNSDMTRICSGRAWPLLPQQAPNVVPPRTQLGPRGLCVTARKKNSIIKSSRAASLVLQEAWGDAGACLSGSHQAAGAQSREARGLGGGRPRAGAGLGPWGSWIKAGSSCSFPLSTLLFLRTLGNI